jgi:uncharacterized protein involved in exopolysaccharide biosynthesis
MSLRGTTDVEVSWQDYLALAQRRKRFFLVPFLSTMVVGLVFFLVAPRVYQSQALIAIQSENLINPLIQGLAMPTAISDRLGTLREEILNWLNLTRLIQEHHLDAKIPKHNQVALERLVQRLRQDISVRLRGRSLIEVSYQGREPAQVQAVVNSLTDIVIERDAAIQEKEAQTAVGFIEAELAVYRQKLEDSERKLREFKELYMTEMPVVTALNYQLRTLEVRLAKFLIDNTPEHPLVVDAKRQIDEVRRQRDEEIQRLVAKGVLGKHDPEILNQLLAPGTTVPADATAEKAKEAYAALVEGLESPEVPAPAAGTQVAVTAQGVTTVQLNDSAATSLTLAPRQQQELARLNRDYTVNETIYRGLLEKLERAKITGRLGEDDEGGKFVVIEQARHPVKPIKPRAFYVLMISLVFGVAFGVGAVVLAEYFDQSIQTAEEAAELLGAPTLGTISTILTAADVAARRQRRKSWFSFKDQLGRLKTYVVNPVWSRVDQALLRWGL